MTTISEKLVTLRKESGATQEEVAIQINRTIGAICNYEKGRRPIRAEHFEKIKKYCLRRKRKKSHVVAPVYQKGQGAQ